MSKREAGGDRCQGASGCGHSHAGVDGAQNVRAGCIQREASGVRATTGGAAASAGMVQPGQPLLDANGQQIMDPATGQPMLAPYPADKRQKLTPSSHRD